MAAYVAHPAQRSSAGRNDASASQMQAGELAVEAGANAVSIPSGPVTLSLIRSDIAQRGIHRIAQALDDRIDLRRRHDVGRRDDDVVAARAVDRAAHRIGGD